MIAALILASAAVVPFQLTPFISLGQSVDGRDFSATPFVEVGRNERFVVGGLETKGGMFLLFLRTDGTAGRSVRQIELLTSGPPSNQSFGVHTTGSCDWLKKKLTLTYGAPVRNESSDTDGYKQRKIDWQVQKTSLVISYWEGTSDPTGLALDCGLKAEILE